MTKFLFVAECCQNHMGDMAKARAMIASAKRSGATMVKFQLLKADQLFEKDDPLYPPVKAAELTVDQLAELKAIADEHGIGFFATPFHPEAIDELVRLGVDAIKIRAADSGNQPLLQRAFDTGKPVYLSVNDVWSFIQANEAFIPDGADLKLLLCISKYPPALADIHFTDIHLADGWSSHYPGVEDALAAAMWALHWRKPAFIIEKHFTLSHTLPTLDQAVSVDPYEFRRMTAMIEALRQMNWAYGPFARLTTDVVELKRRRGEK